MFKKLSLLSVLLASIIFSSCSDSILNSPETEQNTTSLSKIEKPSEKGEYSPAYRGTIVKGFSNLTSVTKTIDGDKGGVINLNGIHVSLDLLNLNTVIMSASLTIPKGAFKGTKDITLTADFNTPGIICEPHSIFRKPLLLDLKYVGINLAKLGLNLFNTRFAYLGDDGKPIEYCDYEGLDLGLLLGILGVRKAELKHFSRLGFSR